MMNWEYTSHIIKGFWMMVIDVYDFFFSDGHDGQAFFDAFQALSEATV